VAVVGDRILSIGSLDELKAATHQQSYTANTTFTDKIRVPGFIAQPANRRVLRAQVGRLSKILSICDANAGTSVEQIERFYARHLPLSREMAKNLQSFGEG